jgi:hypothetical protein
VLRDREETGNPTLLDCDERRQPLETLDVRSIRRGDTEPVGQSVEQGRACRDVIGLQWTDHRLMMNA